MGSFLLLDASHQAITVCWEREAGVSVEEVQMKPDDGDDRTEWRTLSDSLATSALRKNKLQPGTRYVFRRRSRQGQTSSVPGDDSAGQMEDWGPWSEASEPFETLSEGVQQQPPPVVKLREAGALVMEWSEVSAASGYEIQMSSLGGQWVTIAPCFGSTLLRKKGLEDSKLYRFRIRPVFKPANDEEGHEERWGMSPASTPASPAVLNSFLQSQVPQQLVGRGKEVVSRNVLAGKIVAFYFSASWCGPCRKYTPQLAALYSRATAQHKAFEVVFVSLDSDEGSMEKYHAGMPWLAVPFDDPFREEFASSKGVNSIPRLVVTGRRGQELSSNAVGMTWEQLVAWESQG